MKYLWRPVLKQEAQPLKQQLQELESVEETTTTMTAAAANAVEETTRHPRLTSFLEKDNSFLSPWSWYSKAMENYETTSSSSNQKQQYLQFQPGSYFVREIFDWLIKWEESPLSDTARKRVGEVEA